MKKYDIIQDNTTIARVTIKKTKDNLYKVKFFFGSSSKIPYYENIAETPEQAMNGAHVGSIKLYDHGMPARNSPESEIEKFGCYRTYTGIFNGQTYYIPGLKRLKSFGMKIKKTKKNKT